MFRRKKCVDNLGYVIDCPDATVFPYLCETIEVVEIGGKKFAYKNGLYIGEIVLDRLTGKERILTGYYLDTLTNRIMPAYYKSPPSTLLPGVSVELRTIAGKTLVYDKITGRCIGEAMYDPLSNSYKLVERDKKRYWSLI